MTNLKLVLITITSIFTITFFSINTNAQLYVVKEQKDSEGNITVEKGSVGIGIDTPSDKFEIQGNARIWGNGKNNAKLKIGADTKVINSFIDLHNGIPGNGAFKTAGRFIANKAGITMFAGGSTGDFVIRTWNPTSGITFTTNGAPRFRVRHTGLIEMGPGIPASGALNNSMILSVNGNAQKTGGGSWEVLSDKRLKSDVKSYTKGLAEVLEINPVTYKYSGVGGVADTEKTQVGLIAQEFKKIEPDAIGIYKHTEPMKTASTMEEFMEGGSKNMADLEVINEYLTIDNSSITYMLVNGMKEQQSLIEAQKAELETLKETVAKLAESGTSISTSGATEISVLLEGTGTESALLAQNMPNPFSTTTRIEYFIPTDSRNARMSFRDMTGKEIKRIDITNDGIGVIELTAKDLAAGIYSYVLYVNGSIGASKKMVLK